MNRITHREACTQIRAAFHGHAVGFTDTGFFTITTRIYLDADRLTCVCLPALAKKDYQTAEGLTASIIRLKRALSESMLWLSVGRVG